MTDHTHETNDSDELVAFVTARSPAEALIVRGVLRDAGIPAWVEGSMLQDEFSVSQSLMHLQRCRIQIRHVDVGRAEAAMSASRDAAALLDQALEQGFEDFGGSTQAAANDSLDQPPPEI